MHCWNSHLAFAAVLIAACGSSLVSCSQAPPRPPAAAAWLDVEGLSHNALATAERPATVLLFVAVDCPISNAYTPEVNRIVDAYAPRGVAFFAVHADPCVSPDSARTHARDFGYRCPVLLDPGQRLARRAGATVTPEAAVLDPAGGVAYLGRIDDLFAGYGKRRQAPTTRELRDALDALLAGRPLARAAAPAVGCYIPEPIRGVSGHHPQR
jgi:hypothetical protein